MLLLIAFTRTSHQRRKFIQPPIFLVKEKEKRHRAFDQSFFNDRSISWKVTTTLPCELPVELDVMPD